MLRRCLRPALAGLFLCLGFIACTPVNVAAIPTTPEAAYQGVVVLSVTANSARARSITGLFIQQVGGTQQGYILQRVNDGLSRDTFLYMGMVNAGEYLIKRIDFTNGFIELKHTAETLGTFQVGDAETADLGRLVLSDYTSRFLLGRAKSLPDNTDLIPCLTPVQVQVLARKRAKGWTQPPSSRDQVQRYAEARPIGADGLTELEDGTLAAGSRMGQVLVRIPDGRWGTVPVGTLNSLLTLAPLDNGDRLVVGGEFRTLARIDRTWKAHPVAPGNLPMGNIFMIDGNDRDGWLVGMHWGTAITFHRSPRLEAGDWRELFRESCKDRFWGTNYVFCEKLADGFLFATRFGGIQRWRRAAGTFEAVKVPGMESPNILGLKTGDRWTLMRTNGLYATIQVSKDQGATWWEPTLPFTVKWDAPLPYGGSRMITRGALNGTETHVTFDDGVTWKQLQALRAFTTLNATRTKGLFAIDTGAGTGAPYDFGSGIARISRSTDDGATWQLEMDSSFLPPSITARQDPRGE